MNFNILSVNSIEKLSQHSGKLSIFTDTTNSLYIMDSTKKSIEF